MKMKVERYEVPGVVYPEKGWTVRDESGREAYSLSDRVGADQAMAEAQTDAERVLVGAVIAERDRVFVESMKANPGAWDWQ